MTGSHSFFLRGLFLLLLLVGPSTALVIEESTGRHLQPDTQEPSATLITEGVQVALDEAWGLWNSSGVVAYELGFKRLCFCTDEYTAPFVSVVENGGIVEVLDKNATLLDPTNPLFQDAYSVEILFARIQSGLDEGVYEIRVDYDATYGYPTSVYIDYDVRIADEEFSVAIESFQVKAGGQTGYDAVQAQEALDTAWALWNSSELVAYELGFTRLCFCTDEYTAPYVSFVEDGGIVEVLDQNATLLDQESPLFQDAYSVEILFARIQSGLDEGASEIRVDYDATYGYPTSVYIDYDVRIADEEFIVTINSFEAVEDSTTGEQPDDGTDKEVDGGDQPDGTTDEEPSGAATLRMAAVVLTVALSTAMFA